MFEIEGLAKQKESANGMPRKRLSRDKSFCRILLVALAFSRTLHHAFTSELPTFDDGHARSVEVSVSISTLREITSTFCRLEDQFRFRLIFIQPLMKFLLILRFI
jgi:hypothetical protein